MNTSQVHQLLLILDERYGWENEFPPDFQYDKELKKVEAAKTELENIVGLNLELDTQSAQDCYFFAAIKHFEESTDEAEEGILNIDFEVRFSNFGNLATAWVTPAISMPMSDLLSATEVVLEREGFIYVDSAWLMSSRYDGKRQCFGKDGLSWWNRFFDYS